MYFFFLKNMKRKAAIVYIHAILEIENKIVLGFKVPLSESKKTWRLNHLLIVFFGKALYCLH